VAKPVGEGAGVTPGNKIVYTFKQIDSVDAVKNQFGMSSSASVGLGYFSGSAGVQFLQQSDFNSYSERQLGQSVEDGRFHGQVPAG
jgi:hypothetical protein